MNPELEALLQRQLEQIAERAPRTHSLLQEDAALAAEAADVFVASDFVVRSLVQDDTLLADALASGELRKARSAADYAQLLAALGDAASVD